MAPPSTPESHKSSSSELNVTPSPTQMTPFTELGTNSNARSLKARMTQAQLFNDSPSLRNNRVPSAQYSAAAPTSEPLSPAVDWKPRQSLQEAIDSAPTYYYSKDAWADDRASRKPQHPLAFSLMAAQTATPANPVRQPAIPPSDHASSMRTSFPGGLAPSPAIWEGLKSHFEQLELNAGLTPAPVPNAQVPLPSTQGAQPFQLPGWLTQSIEQQSYGNNPMSPMQLGSPVLRQPSAPRGFRPMAAIAQARPVPNPSVHDDDQTETATFSGNYRGEHTVRNASAANLTPEQNCALWLTNLPPDVTHRQLLAQIRNVGRIWCTVINEPDYDRHETAAAKVVFFTPGPAQLLLSQSLTQGLHVGGYAVRVTHNRVKYGEQPLVGSASRVLIITGKTTFVNPESLTEFFKTRFVFEVDEITNLIVHGERDNGGRSVVEYRFGSFRCQAQMGKMALEKDRPQGFEKVEFGPDPCEVGDTLSAYGVAAERIQGKGM
ncbi:hypothetical protein ACHAPJ_006188 [Fusarium lateritium]